MELKPSDKLGPYEIVSAIGKGGMGEVWRSRDPQLGRDVAIKVSAQQFTDRFEREARAIAALNHANVCTLYHIGPNYLVMEYIEGPTLAERIKEGPIPLEEALGYAKQIADALEAAHEKSIVHRDLKPANVKIRTDGSVKVLDFGLAKAGGAQEVTADSPTMTPGTQIGMILGTAGYMSPEQARGKEVDKRADIWAFGVVLYEMITGKLLFEGETVSDSLAAVLKEEPDLNVAPEKVRRRLRACLEKDPKKRLRDIGDVGRAGGQWQISTGGGTSPRWRPDGAPGKAGKYELYYLAPDNKLMALAAVTQSATQSAASGLTFVPGTPEVLFQTHIAPATNRQNYDVARDGRFHRHRTRRHFHRADSSAAQLETAGEVRRGERQYKER